MKWRWTRPEFFVSMRNEGVFMTDEQRAKRIIASNKREGAQRFRVGLTGLFGILIIVGLASAMMSRLSEAVEGQAAPAAQSKKAAAAAAPAVEPLVELGVAPAETNTTQAPAPVAPTQ
jgi:hypothetical protein